MYKETFIDRKNEKKSPKKSTKRFRLILALFFLLIFLLIIITALLFKSKTKTHEIILGQKGFEPQYLKLEQGDSVVFKTTENDDYWPASDPHPTHVTYSGFDPRRALKQQEIWSFTFNQTGEWLYHNHLIPNQTGVIYVKDKSSVLDFWQLLSKEKLKESNIVPDLKSEIQNAKSKRTEFSEIESIMIQYLQEFGVDKTMNVLQEAFIEGNININSCHRLTHVAGHYAYKPYGENGEITSLAVPELHLCGEGYKHGVEAEITLRSDKPIQELHEFCQATMQVFPGATCYHGVGHAEIKKTLDVLESVQLCDRLIPDGPNSDPTDCYKGVFSGLAFEYEGVDADTGNRYPNGPTLEPDFDNPLDYCSELDIQYQEACASQLSRMLLDNATNPSVAFQDCMDPKYREELQVSCVQIISAVLAQWAFTSDTLFSPESDEAQWPIRLREGYINGIAGEYRAQVNSGKAIPKEQVCGSFSLNSDQDFCYSILISS